MHALALWLATATLWFFFSGVVRAGDPNQFQVAVIVSLKIKPYMDTLGGIQNVLKTRADVRWDVFFFDSDQPVDHAAMTRKIKKKTYDVLLAVGPEAMRFIWNAFPGDVPLKLFSMVRKPRRVIAAIDTTCGIALDIPAHRQLREFERVVPMLNRIGLIYDPDNNADFAMAASAAAQGGNFEIVHLRVNSRQDILPEFLSRRSQINALWMIPDATVISESIIPFLIKEALANNIAVFGYNRFFNENGAAISLVRDYAAIGRHVATMVLSAIDGRSCRLEDPDYEVLINTEVLKAIGHPVDVNDPAPGKEAP